MNNTTNLFRLAVILAVALLLQILIFDNVEFIGLCNPFVYVVVLLSVPLGCPVWFLMLIGFGTGLLVDMSANTPGMHAAACVLAAYLRQYILSAIAFRDTYKSDDMPTIGSYGLPWYAKYTVMMVAAHHVMLFLMEQYDSFFFWPTVARIILSVIASTACILLVGFLMPRMDSTSE